MKAVILAGGLGTRIAEETDTRPKPMIEIGGKPILWHIMKSYSAYKITDFVICLGYKGYIIKEYFANYFLHTSDVTFDLAHRGEMQIHHAAAEPWRVTLIDTGAETQIGGRIKRALPYIDDDTFLLTYGDGVSDVDIDATIKLHKKEKRFATVTAAQPPGRFGAIKAEGNRVTGFREKPAGDEGWINAGFFVLSKKVGDYIENDSIVWEREPMERLATENQLTVYFHKGFWHPMDTLRDKRYLESLYAAGKAPWKTWE